MVCVEMTTLKSFCVVTARIAGTRYAKLFPTPVPASTSSCRRRKSASETASAMSSCCGRDSKPGYFLAISPSWPRIFRASMRELWPNGRGEERLVACGQVESRKVESRKVERRKVEDPHSAGLRLYDVRLTTFRLRAAD